MTKQEMLYEFYQELVDKGEWETENYTLILRKGGLLLKSKKNKKEISLNILE